MSRDPLPRELAAIADLILLLWSAATTPASKPVRRRESDLPIRNGTLRPGSNTPLWNQLVKTARPLLARRGAKAQLARVLGLPRQRTYDFFGRRTAAPDAERTLLTLAWVAKHRQGIELS